MENSPNVLIECMQNVFLAIWKLIDRAEQMVIVKTGINGSIATNIFEYAMYCVFIGAIIDLVVGLVRKDAH